MILEQEIKNNKLITYDLNFNDFIENNDKHKKKQIINQEQDIRNLFQNPDNMIVYEIDNENFIDNLTDNEIDPIHKQDKNITTHNLDIDGNSWSIRDADFKSVDAKKALKASIIKKTISVIIISFILLIISLSIHSYRTPEARLNRAARHVLQDLVSAKFNAIKNSCKVIVYLSNEYQYVIWSDINNNSIKDYGEENIKNITTDYHDVILTDYQRIEFDSKGSASLSGNITISNSSGSKNIKINITGNIKIEEAEEKMQELK
ncbi:hypothetical protein GMMP15_140038 [Candidatus Magnetomoraceae bacterium gMMP-15]